jgi:hypothetical protein
MSIRVQRSQDPLMRLTAMHERENCGAFLFRAARRAAESLELHHLGPDRATEQQGITSAELGKLSAEIRKAEVQSLMAMHMQKPMHSVFFKHVRDHELSTKLTYSFLKSAGLKSETEGFIMACQDGVLNTLVYRHAVLKQNVDTTCRSCKQHPETIMHIISACPFYAVSMYVHRHNAALRIVYYHLRHKYGVDITPVLPYLPGEIEAVVENSRCRIYWNYSFPTTRQLSATKPDIVLFDLDEKTITLIEMTCPAEYNISRKEVEKRDKYRDLMVELRQIHSGYKVRLVVLVIGVLGGMKESFLGEVKNIPKCRSNSNMLACKMQKAVILGSLRVLRAHEVLQ